MADVSQQKLYRVMKEDCQEQNQGERKDASV